MKQSSRLQLLFSFSLFFFISGCGNAQSDPSGKSLVKACVAIKDKVSVLKEIKDLEARVIAGEKLLNKK